ncbi:fatty acid hydroxylase family protein [Novosphingobium sp. PhB165]|uniref:sterol desaturase family protein n=1 Tax=Novosphingobium sp. PhB165 TaxID=2485105 RepID=UPI0010EF7D63|nr:sterol desaturase family protein [Novosphingobium sp. PhB165]TCM14709.1 fatty acid hydroxylase family protein [Novosphingobium sp. PhB165]
MQNLGQWVLAVTGIILVAEIVTGRHRAIYSRGDWFVNGICIFAGAVVRPLGAVAVAALIGWLLPAGRGALSWVPFVPAVIVITLLAEFANYWVHRGSHILKDSRWFDWLWRMHRTHHTAKYVNVLLNFRISLFWALVAGLTWVMSLAVYLGQAKAAGFAVVIFSFWGIFTHSDFRWDDTIRRHRIFGPMFRGLEHIFISPGIHHSHHGYGKDGGNYRNFGIFLSIFDWMFGTLHIPNGRPFRYGIPGSTPHWADDAFSPINIGSLLASKRVKEDENAPA